ncbi:EGF-like repeat and discoidin I-like domain-containing protein 3 [Montipora capricornis]|uniref:EGF-like repeat and discoidin I-like domain-containing protein 3 n=1 Tax=Montipora capricornis TaxID=246305 RepID=UPI0035F17882
MKSFGCTTFLKASLLILIIFPSYAVATARRQGLNTPMLSRSCNSSISEKKAGKAISRGEPHIGVSFVNFKEDKFFYLNITILGYSHVDWMPQCSFACLETPTCFSYNLAAYPDINGKRLCEILPSDKYNNLDKFMSSESFHHLSIASPCSGWPCKNNGTCLPLYEENSYKCVCKAGFTGRDCEKDIDECSSENECHVYATCKNTIGSYNCTCQNGYEGDGTNCTACVFAFDSQLNASSQWDSNHAPSQGKLNYQESPTKAGAWMAAQSDNSQWLQVDLGSQKRVRTLATQGRNYSLHWPHEEHEFWVTKYKLQFRNDGENFQYYREQGVVKEFAGNKDRDTEVHHDLNPSISARYFRFRPTSWHGYISMRVGLFGCPDR